jgi:hypothetical protein
MVSFFGCENIEKSVPHRGSPSSGCAGWGGSDSERVVRVRVSDSFKMNGVGRARTSLPAAIPARGFFLEERSGAMRARRQEC